MASSSRSSKKTGPPFGATITAGAPDACMKAPSLVAHATSTLPPSTAAFAPEYGSAPVGDDVVVGGVQPRASHEKVCATTSPLSHAMPAREAVSPSAVQTRCHAASMTPGACARVV